MVYMYLYLYAILLNMHSLYVCMPHIACSSGDIIPEKTKMLLPPNPRATQILESSRLSNTLKRTANVT